MTPLATRLFGPVRGHLTRRFLAAMLPLLGGIATAQNPVVATAPAPTDYSGVGTFEATGIPPFQYAPSWAPWTMAAFTAPATGAGIARNGAPALLQSAPAPEGQSVAFVQGLGTAACTTPIPVGTWRLRFLAAQRVQAGLLDTQKLRITINGTTIFEEPPLFGHFSEYATEPFRVVAGLPAPTVVIAGLATAGDQMALIDRVLLEPLVPWSATSTWVGGVLPASPNDVRIPAGVAVHLDGTFHIDTIKVEGSLVTKRVNSGLTTRCLLVAGPGSTFEVGREGIPFRQQFTLTLKGASTDPAYPTPTTAAGTKYLMAMDGGRIDMHGAPKRSWTKLAAMTPTTIQVADPVTWAAGDEIVLASSSLTHFDGTSSAAGGFGSEVAVIASVHATSGVITLMQPLGKRHLFAAPTTYTNPQGTRSWTVDMRAEVGLLTHNVKIQGDANSSATQFGAHVMLMNCPMCRVPGFGRFESVQMSRMGQKNLVGRYPMHWHMQLANGRGQYLRGSSIRESYNRAVTIHGSDHVTVEDNVAYDHMGHGIFFEDGGEQYNRILGNLVLRTRKPAAADAIMETDHFWAQAQNRSPAAFWITNPNNEFRNNVAADCPGTGYWFALHSHPFGLSQAPGSAAQSYFAGRNGTTAALGAFQDNVCHCCGTAIDLNDSVDDHGTGSIPDDVRDDTLLTNVGWVPPTPVTLDRFTAYACATALYAGGGSDRVTFVDTISVDNEWHVQLACPFEVTQSLLVEDSGTGTFLPIHPAFSGQAYVVYDGPARLTNSHLVGFDGLGTHPFGTYGMVVTSVFGAAMRRTNHLLSGLTYPPGNGLPNVDFDDFTADPLHLVQPPATSPADPRHWGIAVVDVDGSLSSNHYLRRTLVTNHPMMHIVNPSGATPDVTFGHWTRAWLSPFKWGHLVLFHQDANGFSLLPSQQPTMLFTREAFEGWRGHTYTYDFQIDSYRQLPLVVRRPTDAATREVWYTVDWAPPAISRKVSIQMDDLAAGDVTRIHLRNANNWSGETVTIGATTLTPVASVAALDGLTTTAYARTGAQDLWLRIVTATNGRPVVISW